ncbi:hypothetical protein D3C80_2030630 [compost metagenome]
MRGNTAYAVGGHHVVAVDSSEAMRNESKRLHADNAIEWVDDQLPVLQRGTARDERFDLILLAAVWMYLDETKRA